MTTTRIYVLARYGTYQPGDSFEVDDAELALWYLRDSPESFSLTPPAVAEDRAIEAPPADRMVRKGRTRGA